MWGKVQLSHSQVDTSILQERNLSLFSGEEGGAGKPFSRPNTR